MNNILVIGGGGFVGKALLRTLRRKGFRCSVLGRNTYPELLEEGVRCIQADICDKNSLIAKTREFDTIFHVAALAGVWGRWKHYYSANVVGTQNVLSACKKNNIGVLVYTSTPSVVFGGQDIVNGDETLAYSEKFLCNYAKSKVLAEQLVLSHNTNTLKTCAIRPHLVWGPEDPHLIPRLIQRGKAGELKIVGDGNNFVDITYIDNVAHAHVLAAENLHSSAQSAGNAYFIGQERPVLLWQWINELFTSMGIDMISKKVSLKTAYTAGALLEFLHGVFLPRVEPKMTRFLAQQLAKSHYFSHKKAKDDLGYEPIISIEEGMDKLVFWLKTL